MTSRKGNISGQALATGTSQAAGAQGRRFLRTHAFRAGGIWLLGFRGGSSARATTFLELPRRGRRRHHARYAVSLALCAR